jgi:3-oxoacyl-(acyl-carrier-protein) synthase
MSHKYASISGIGMITSAGLSIDDLWNACKESKVITSDGLGKISEKNLNIIQNHVDDSKWLKKKPIHFSRGLYFSLYSIIQAVTSAGWKKFSATDSIFIGTTTGTLSMWEKEMFSFFRDTKNTKLEEKIKNQSLSSLGNQIRESLGFEGKIFIISSACSASTQAFVEALNSLNAKQATRCIVGGVEELGELTIRGFSSLKLHSTARCTPFDQNRAGINLSEGAAFYTLEKKPSKSIAKILGGNTFLDSYHTTSPHPEAHGYCKSIEKTLRDTGVKQSQISLVHAHGTGSYHNDGSEAFGLHNIFSNKTPIISTKGTHGHALGASGSLEVGICLKIIENNIIPKVTGLVNIDEKFDINLPKENINTEIKYILKTTLGFGGVNTTLLLQKEETC